MSIELNQAAIDCSGLFGASFEHGGKVFSNHAPVPGRGRFDAAGAIIVVETVLLKLPAIFFVEDSVHHWKLYTGFGDAREAHAFCDSPFTEDEDGFHVRVSCFEIFDAFDFSVGIAPNVNIIGVLVFEARNFLLFGRATSAKTSTHVLRLLKHIVNGGVIFRAQKND